MSDSHLQLNHNGSTSTRKTVLWATTKEQKMLIIGKLFNQKNWSVSTLEQVNGSHWKVISSCDETTLKINLYISSIRDEDRQPDEFKMQLGSTYPVGEVPGWINLVLGIYTISEEGVSENEYILSGYEINRYDFSSNPSIRGTRTLGLQKAFHYGMYVTEKSVLFRPEFIYYYINTLKGNVTISSSLELSQNIEYKDYNSNYRPYISAIKSKPFLLLAGISGTGKSRIVRELARACWEAGSEEYKAPKPKNYEMIQVKPNWHDSSELIGYVSRVSGKPEFIIGDFLKFIARAWENEDIPHFLCLDEMNLAPVEQYFAEYLSVIESRKNKDGKVVTDAIVEKCAEQWYFDLTAKLTTNEEVRTRFKNEGISIPKNLIVVGTVNMDETTFSFSRKVLDRAMTIEMNEVDLDAGLTNRYEQIGKLGEAELIGDAVEGVDVYADNKEVCDTAITYLKSINAVLEGTPFKVAYRTRNEFLLYVVNNLPYNKNEQGEEIAQEVVIARALDEITNMKILSRIEGDETKVSKRFLTELSTTIANGLKEISGKEYASTNGEGAEFAVSLAKLEEMKKRLDSGYTSFWS